MRPPSSLAVVAPQHTLPRPILLALAAWIATHAGCATPPPGAWSDALREEASALEQALSGGAPERPPPEAVRIRLAFDAQADLDLYVTDPWQESLYFANNSVRSGGELDVDATCVDRAPRIETASFAAPPPGRNRVSVDFMARCEIGVTSVPYVIEVWARGQHRLVRSLAEFGQFDPLVLEFDVGGNGPVAPR